MNPTARVAAALAVLAAVLGLGLGTPAAAEVDLRLGGVPVDLLAGTTQVVTVDHSGGDRARVTLWVSDDGAGWRRVLATDRGTIGYGGLVPGQRRRQGSGATPLGTYAIEGSFGTRPRQDGWRLPYRELRPGDYWVGDNASRFYNRFRTRADGGFRWWLPARHPDASERLLDYPRQYEYAMTTSFNAEQVRHRGFAIFLHVNGDGATAGCVGVPRPVMRALMRAVDPARRPVIAIGR